MPVRCTQRTEIEPDKTPLGAGPLRIPMIKQEQSQWCWAACADMVIDFYGNPGVKQCELANWLFRQSGCCSSPSSSFCNKPCQVGDVSRVFANWGIRSNYVNGTIPFDTVDAKISASRPIEVGYRWNGGGGHVALVIETTIINGRQVVRVNDPAYGSGGVYYSDLLTAYGQGTWFATWTGIRR